MEDHLSNKLNEKVSEFKALLNHIVTEDELKETFKNAKTEVKKAVQENPFPVLLGAVAVGFILGKILKR
jgi:ElaB/YqjD/DUF883 family membrane-anchored ribosome-binding protein